MADEIKQSKSGKWILFLVSFFCTLPILYIISIYIPILSNTLQELFGKTLFTVMIALIILFIVVLFFYSLLLYALYYEDKEKLNWWAHLTIFFMISALGLGYFFIHTAVGVPNLDSDLWNVKTNEVIGKLDCRSTFEYFVAGSEVNCDIQPEIQDYVVNTIFTFENESKQKVTNRNKLSFIAPENVKHISFNIFGYEDPKNILELGTGRYFKFLNSEEETQRKDKIMAYCLGLIAIILFSIPSMMINLRNLFRNKG